MNVYQTDINGVFVGITTADQDPMDENNWLIPARCVQSSPPDYTIGQLARWNGSEWSVENIPVEEPEPEPDLEIQARLRRNSLLTQSDWSQLPDAPVNQAAWAAYRSLLRDVPQQSGFPADITWPTKPE